MATVKANVNVRIDAGVKNRAAQLYAKMGLDMTTAIDMFLRQCLAENGLPFKPSPEKSLDDKLAEALKKKASVRITLPTDENGNMYVDKEKYPDLYDWAVNG
jgi:DNA-damage-inducible protein J